MQEHPVPQNITSYEFHLVGNMTLKQFFELLAGGVAAFATYSSNLPIIFKYPLIIIFVLLGVALAFVPVEERPLDQWFLAFIRAIYNPTKFYWRRLATIPEVFQTAALQYPAFLTPRTEEPQIDVGKKRTQAKEYFQTIQPSTEPKDEMQERASELLRMFSSQQAGTIKKTQPPSPQAAQQQIRQTTQQQKDTFIMTETDTVPKSAGMNAGLSGVIQVSSITPTAPLTPDKQFPAEQIKRRAAPKPVQIKSTTTPITVATPKPKQPEVKLQSQAQQQYFVQSAPTQQQATQAQELVKTNAKLPFPSTPTQPNIVVGMVLDTNMKIVEGAIIDIQDSTGMPLRALKSNMLGQFSVTSPLPAGEYTIVVEKDGYTFTPQKLVISNNIIPPLEITGTANTT